MGEVRPTTAPSEPFGFIGYSIVTLPSSSTYFSATQFCRIASSFTASFGQKQRPSPCATHTPSVEPSMPCSMMCPLSRSRTFTKRDSKPAAYIAAAISRSPFEPSSRMIATRYFDALASHSAGVARGS